MPDELNDKPLERRWANLSEAKVYREVKDGATVPRIVGTAAVYGVICDDLLGFPEYVDAGALKQAVVNPDTRCLFNHSPDWLLGRTTSKLLPNGKHTLTVWEESDGLHFDNFPPDTEFGRAVVIGIDRGDITQASFQFTVEKVEWIYEKEKEPERHIQIVDRLLDVSPVTFPAYPTTHVGLATAMRAAGVDMLAVKAGYVKSHLNQNLSDEETRALQYARAFLGNMLSKAGADDVDGSEMAQVRYETEQMGMRLALAKLNH